MATCQPGLDVTVGKMRGRMFARSLAEDGKTVMSKQIVVDNP